MTQKSLYEQFVDGFSNAVNDIREKYEEAVFGQVVNDKALPEVPENLNVTTSGEVAVTAPANAWQEKIQQARDKAEKEPPSPDHDIER